MAEVEPLCDRSPQATLELGRGHCLSTFELASGEDQIFFLSEVILGSLPVDHPQALQADGAASLELLVELNIRSHDGVLDGDLASAFH